MTEETQFLGFMFPYIASAETLVGRGGIANRHLLTQQHFCQKLLKSVGVC